MKRGFIAIAILFISTVAIAQNKSKRASKIATHHIPVTNHVITLSSTVSYNALNNTDNENRLHIWDPTLRALDARAKGANIRMGNSGIVGLPKRAFGFANGQIVLRTSDAVSSGSTTGSGAVGTGTSPGTMGSTAQSIGVNGKSPYAGTGMWGTNATLVGANGRDAAARSTNKTKDD